MLDELANQTHEVVIFMTGVAISLLFEAAEQLGRRAELVASLKRVTTLCRGSKPSAALRGFGVTPTLSAREPFTAAELIDALSDRELVSKRVLLFNYGERSETLSETLLARRAELREFWLYRWQLPEDTGPLEALVRRITLRERRCRMRIGCDLSDPVSGTCIGSPNDSSWSVRWCARSMDAWWSVPSGRLRARSWKPTASSRRWSPNIPRWARWWPPRCVILQA